MNLFAGSKFIEVKSSIKELASTARKDPKGFVKLHAKKILAEAKHSMKELMGMIRNDPKEFFKLFRGVLWKNKLKYAILLFVAIVTIHIPTVRTLMAGVLVRDICNHKNSKK